MGHRSTRTFLMVALAAAFTLGVAASSGRAASDAKPVVVKVHADWCGTCTRLNPTWKQLESEFDGRADLVVLDVTNKDTIAASRATAEKMGLMPFFEEYKSQTGTIGVLDAKREPIAVLKGETDISKYEQALNEALAEKS